MNKSKVFKGLLFSAAILGMGFVATNSASADQIDGTWAPRSVEEIKASVSGDVYTIQWGDYLSGISEATGITVEDLAAWNNIANKDLIYAGNQLLVNGAVVTDSNGNSFTLSGASVAGVQAKSAERAQEAQRQAEEAAKAAETPSTNTGGSTGTEDNTDGNVDNGGSTGGEDNTGGGNTGGGNTGGGNTGGTETPTPERVEIAAPADVQAFAAANGLTLGKFYQGEDNGALGQYTYEQYAVSEATANFFLLTEGSPFFVGDGVYSGWSSRSNSFNMDIVYFY